ncbi:MAG TPA: hypothetical protein VIG33_06185 [Pseudobdellovibrionaceae bacterium]|jgi:hypothetical protein
MKTLKVNNLILFLSLWILGCATSSYKIVTNSENKKEIITTSDRIALECSDVGSDEGAFFGFSIHVLDNENTVIDVIQTNKLDKESCEKRIAKISNILGRGQLIHIYGLGSLEEPREQEKAVYLFKGLGTYHGNGRVLQFMYILNEKGGCYDAYSADKKPCPQD